LLLFTAVALLGGCPNSGADKADKGGSATTAPPAQQPPAGTDPAPADTFAPAGSPTAVQDGEPDNPRPTGSEWVWAPKLSYRIGETISVEFASGAGEQGWIGLIPASVTAEDAAANDAEDVAYAYLPKDTNMVSLIVPQEGSFVLRLISGSEAADKVLFTSPIIMASQWAKGDRTNKVAPYITLGEQTKPGKIELPTGAPLPVYWMLPETYPSTAWIGMIPANVTSQSEADNDAADVDYQYVKSGTQGYLTFFLQQPGDYVFRLFPSDVAGCEAVAESEPFTVFNAPDS